MWRRHYGEVLLRSISSNVIMTLGRTHKGLNKTDRSEVGGGGGNSKI